MTTEWSRMPEAMLRQVVLRKAIIDAASPVQWIPTGHEQWHCAYGGRFFCASGGGQHFTLWETGDHGAELSFQRKAESWNEVNRLVLAAVGEVTKPARSVIVVTREEPADYPRTAESYRATIDGSAEKSALATCASRAIGDLVMRYGDELSIDVKCPKVFW